MRSLIIGNSPDLKTDGLAEIANNFELIIAADGAAERLPPGISPHIVCGDFDSIDLAGTKTRLTESEFRHIPDQELYSDIEKAVLIAIERGANDIVIAGLCGGRIDHSFSSLSLLVRYHSEIKLCLLGPDNESNVWMLSPSSAFPQPMRITTNAGELISFLPLTPKCQVTLVGVVWPLNNDTVCAGTNGISNRAIGNIVEIQVHAGTGIICKMARE